MDIQKAKVIAKSRKRVEFGPTGNGGTYYAYISYWQGGKNERAYIGVGRMERTSRTDQQGYIDLVTGDVYVTGSSKTMDKALELLGIN